MTTNRAAQDRGQELCANREGLDEHVLVVGVRAGALGAEPVEHGHAERADRGCRRSRPRAAVSRRSRPSSRPCSRACSKRTVEPALGSSGGRVQPPRPRCACRASPARASRRSCVEPVSLGERRHAHVDPRASPRPRRRSRACRPRRRRRSPRRRARLSVSACRRSDQARELLDRARAVPSGRPRGRRPGDRGARSGRGPCARSSGRRATSAARQTNAAAAPVGRRRDRVVRGQAADLLVGREQDAQGARCLRAPDRLDHHDEPALHVEDAGAVRAARPPVATASSRACRAATPCRGDRAGGAARPSPGSRRAHARRRAQGRRRAHASSSAIRSRIAACRPSATRARRAPAEARALVPIRAGRAPRSALRRRRARP